MLHPSGKEKKVLEKHKKTFQEKMNIKNEDLFDYYKIFISIWNILEHS